MGKHNAAGNANKLTIAAERIYILYGAFTMKQPLHNRISIPIILIVSISIGGCYTLLKHPSASDSPDTNDFSRCADCHGDFSHAGYYNPYYGEPWWDFYATPWWYDDVLIDTDEGAVPASRMMFDRQFRYRDDQPSASPPVAAPPRTGDPPPVEQGEKTVDESGAEPATRRDTTDRKRDDESRERSRDEDDKRDADESTDSSRDKKRK
jgi:hypothetical protein